MILIVGLQGAREVDQAMCSPRVLWWCERAARHDEHVVDLPADGRALSVLVDWPMASPVGRLLAVRAFRPELLLPLGSDVWLVEEFQPVAVVIDPVTGVVRRAVSWAALPPPGPGELDRRVRHDRPALWVQHETGGPLARVGLDEIEVLVPTDGLGLVACGPDTAWCASPAADQELLDGQEASPTRALGPGRLLRATSDGQRASVDTEWPVRAVYAVVERLLVEVDLEPFTRRPLGAGMCELVRQTQWLSLAWGTPLRQG